MYRSWGDFASRLRRKIAAWAGSPDFNTPLKNCCKSL
jgi:hypothetical protein